MSIAADLQIVTKTQKELDEIQQVQNNIANEQTIAQQGIVYVRSIENTDGYINVTLESPGVYLISVGPEFGALAFKNFAVPNIGAFPTLTVSNPPTKAEVDAIVTALNTAWVKIASILNALN